jgi:hypothetical protein
LTPWKQGYQVMVEYPRFGHKPPLIQEEPDPTPTELLLAILTELQSIRTMLGMALGWQHGEAETHGD